MIMFVDIFLFMFDLVLVCIGGSVVEVLYNFLDLVCYVECLGFNCFWLVEYYNMDGIVSFVIVLLIGYIVGGILWICVGLGGVMLLNYVLLVVVENFGILEMFYLGCIDFGFGCVLGVDQVIMCVLCCDCLGNGDDFFEQVVELEMLFGLCCFQQSLLVVLGEGIQVLIWLFGLSLFSVYLVVQKGLFYVFVLYFVLCYLYEVLCIYCSNFQFLVVFDKFYVMIGVLLIVVFIDEEVEFFVIIVFQCVLVLICGESLKQKLLVESMVLLWLFYEQDVVGSFFGLVVIGGLEKVCVCLEIFLEQIGVDEFIFISDFYEYVYWLCFCEIVVGLKGV